MATIDERLEALITRHEALTQTVELISHMQQKTEKEIDRFAKLARKVAENHNERITKLEKKRG
jgi:cytoplasmic iron level regulating protein YaaA (DUF328/UPF0246 family)